MPFLRVVRDKRGYETTYLMHWYRDGYRQRSRVLYVFRTPAGVRVGREALEPGVLQELETQYPDITFDWNVVFDNQQVVDTTLEPRRRRPKREDEEPVAVAVPPAAESESGATVSAAPSVPARIEGATPDEQIAFLARWYQIVRERIARRTADPERQAALNALAERINPVSWTDADQITAGLQQAAEALERLAHVFAKRRRRSRRRSGELQRTPVEAGQPDS